jgi:hypothetical protein
MGVKEKEIRNNDKAWRQCESHCILKHQTIRTCLRSHSLLER